MDLKQHLSIIAIDKKTNQVIGFSISEDPKLPHAINATDYLALSENFEPFFAILDNLHHQCLHTHFNEKEC